METRKVASRKAQTAGMVAVTADMAVRTDRLAALLGPSCQTLRQLYGRGGQWLSYLVFAGVTVALLAWAAVSQPQAAQEGVFLACVLGAILPLVLLRPADRLAGRRQRGLWGRCRVFVVVGRPGRRHAVVGQRDGLAGLAWTAAQPLVVAGHRAR